jgi:hypothetical protein
VLTVMARTPAPGKPDGVVTAFLVTPDMPGFQITEARMEKLGLRGTATARLAFENMVVPKENILGPLGGLSSLTVLDFGRTTFGALHRRDQTVSSSSNTRGRASSSTARCQVRAGAGEPDAWRAGRMRWKR